MIRPDTPMVRCPRCFGRGYKPKPHKNNKPGFRAITCAACGGTGQRPATARDLKEAK